jgi:hypothetical protein
VRTAPPIRWSRARCGTCNAISATNSRTAIVQAQRDLSTAQNSELRALLDYRRALVDYERVQQSPATRGANITVITGN